MNDIFRDLLDTCVIVYLDDILVFSPDEETHKQHLETVIDKLRKNKLYANRKKCSFFQKEIDYLGYVVGGGIIKTNPKLVDTVKHFPPPEDR